MSLRNKFNGLSMNDGSKVNGGSRGGVGGGGGGGGEEEEKPENWEKRPSGMLVQKRIDSDQPIKLPPTIRVRVKYGLIYHEIHISSQATFGELKKMLTGPTGLHHEDQKLFYKKKEKDSKQFLDVVGVKDKSKLVLEEDPISQEKRYYETRRNAKMEKAAKAVSEISLVVDKLAGQVSALESVISKGGRVPEKVIVNAIELLMNELVRLDGIPADGDVKLQRKMQVSRVQKYVETLDVLKAKNSMPAGNEVNTSNQKTANGGRPPLPPKQLQKPSLGHSPLRPPPPQQQQQQQQQQARDATPEMALVTTQWEMFDSTPPLIALSPTRSPESTSQKPEKLMFPWELLE